MSKKNRVFLLKMRKKVPGQRKNSPGKNLIFPLTFFRFSGMIVDVVKQKYFTERGETVKSDTFHMSLLYDYYGELLTDKQKELFDLYYNEDLSLAEIAEHAGISRQGVRDAIVRSETILRETEDKLGLVKKYAGYESKLEEIRQAAGYIAQVNAKLRNFEIAKNVDLILALTGEMQ